MGKWKIAGTALSAATVGVLVLNLMPASGGVQGKTFTLCEKNGRHDYEREVDVNKEGFSPGDQFIFSEPEFNTSGDRVGRVTGVATVIKNLERDGLVQVNLSLNLKGGRIEMQTTSKFSNLSGGTAIPIIGGSGKYNNASGVVKVYSQPCAGAGKKGDHVEVHLN